MGKSAAVRAAKLLSLIVAGTCVAATMSVCGGNNGTAPSPTPTAVAGLATPVSTPETVTSATPTAPPRSTAAASTPTPIETASGGQSGPITFSPGERLLPSDLLARGVGEPGRGPFTGERLIIPRINVDAAIVPVTVGADGSMPPPPSVSDVAWYDFSGFPSLGGSPGNGGNVVLAGDAGRMGVGLGVFWNLPRVTPGDYVEIVLTSGEVCYRIEFNKLASTAEVDWSYVVRATAEESVSLITAGADANSRRVAWGRRASCADAPTATPTPTAPSGHYSLKIIAENYRFTIVGGSTIPKGVFSVDVTLELRDSGVRHGITFFNSGGYPGASIDPVEGPATVGTSFLVGLPELAGRYTFQCPVHREMTGSITVESP